MKINDQLPATFFAILGGGDLTVKKIIPALYGLFLNHHMPVHFSIVIVDRLESAIEKFRKLLHEGVNKFSRHGKVSVHSWNQFALHIHYIQGELQSSEIYHSLKKYHSQLSEEWSIAVHSVFYMAVPNAIVSDIAKHLSQAGLTNDMQKSRVVLEKPMGQDLVSVMELNNSLAKHLQEQQIFRIDHSLGKEIVQNILALRFANPIFEPVWNHHYVEYVALTVAEVSGVGHLGNYYDQIGALRDMVPGYLLQLLSLVSMEPMISLEANEIRNKMVDVLRSIQPLPYELVNHVVVRGQYEKGRLAGKDVPGYQDEVGVLPDSQTETFVALKLFIDNWRWSEVPFYIRTGKRLARQVSEIVIQFRQVPHKIFSSDVFADWLPARIVLTILPDAGIMLRFMAKQPGMKFQLKPVDMKFNYVDNFSLPVPDAYETLLWDIMKNDATLFMRADQVEAVWRLIAPIQKVWLEKPHESIPLYTTGSWGPRSVQKLFIQKEHQWPEPIELVNYHQRIYKS